MNLGADFDNAVLHLDNLLGGGDFGETINNLLSALAPTIWDQVCVSIWIWIIKFKAEMIGTGNMCPRFLEVFRDKKSFHLEILRNLKGQILCILFTTVRYLI